MAATPKKYIKKPVTIEAMQLTLDNYEDVAYWCGGQAQYDPESVAQTLQVAIPTLEGTMTARLNDYVIKGVKGEFYPCKPDIFAETYDVGNQATP